MKISSNTQLKDLNKIIYQPDLELKTEKVIFLQRTQRKNQQDILFEKYIAIGSGNFERIKKSYTDFVQKVSDLQTFINSKEKLTDSESKKVHELGETLQVSFEKFWIPFIVLGVID